MGQATPTIREDIQENQRSAQGPLYRVIIHNDDVTPMDFVLFILSQVFLLPGVRAVQVMYTAHYHGSAYVQTLPQKEAEQRVHRAQFSARIQGFPLMFTLEKE